MFWLSILNLAPELEEISQDASPYAFIKKFWRFCNTYGEYQSLPPSQRRQFICTQTHDSAASPSEPC